MARPIRRPLLAGLVWLNARAKRLAIRLTRWTGKSREYVHPKHLLGEASDHYWYLAYLDRDALVLDVGCGNGMHTLKAAARCRGIVGLDYAGASLAVGRREAVRRRAPVLFVQADAEEGLPTASGRFDLVLCLDMLEHVHKRDLVLGEIRRSLKPGGRLLLGVPNRGTWWKRQLEAAGLFAWSDPDHKIEYTLDELRDELARNGGEIITLHTSVIDMPLVGAFDIIGGLSLRAYRSLTALRTWLARRHPEQNAGFFAVCRFR